MTFDIPHVVFFEKHIFQIIESESSTSDMDEFLRYYRLEHLEQYLSRYVILFGIYSSFENRSFLKSMLLNHIQTIEKAGGRKTDVSLCDLGERLYGTLTGSVLSSRKGRKIWEK